MKHFIHNVIKVGLIQIKVYLVLDAVTNDYCSAALAKRLIIETLMS